MKTTNHNEFAQMGLAALLPGMRYMLELMQKALDENTDLLAAMQGGIESIQEVLPKKRMGRPPGSKNKPSSNGWPADPEERSAEMKRRLAMRGKPAKTAEPAKANLGHPRDASHPEHAKWLATMRKKSKRAWNSLSPAKRKARLAAMAAGRQRANTPVVELEKTA